MNPRSDSTATTATERPTMSVDLSPVSTPSRQFRLDPRRPALALPERTWAVLAWIALASGFVLIGGGNLDPGPIEARLGLAAGEAVGPFGQVYGGWDPALWPAQVVASHVWAWGYGGRPVPAAIRWPAAIAGLLIGLILSRRASARLGQRAGILTALCFFGGIALIDRSAGAGIDLIAALGVIGALDRILGKGSDWIAGLWAALAVLSGGWPPLAMILLPIVVLGRQGATLSARLLIPPVLAFAGWSAWALSVAPAEAWAAACTLPLTQPSAWTLSLEVLALGLPWSPFALLAAWRSVRDGWTDEGRAVTLGWLQVVGVALLAGTVIPGLAVPAKMTAIAGLAFVAAAGLDRVWSGTLPRAPRVAFFAMALIVVLLWTALAVLGGGFLAASVSYYRQVSLLLIALGMAVAWITVAAAWHGKSRWALGMVIGVAICLKLAHWGIYVPEWNYRKSQGPWGRAIGQWVLPNWPIFTFHTWPYDLAFATERPVRQLADPLLLKYKRQDRPKYVLLLPSELRTGPSRPPGSSRSASSRTSGASSASSPAPRGTWASPTTRGTTERDAFAHRAQSFFVRDSFSVIPLMPNRRASSASTSLQAISWCPSRTSVWKTRSATSWTR